MKEVNKNNHDQWFHYLFGHQRKRWFDVGRRRPLNLKMKKKKEKYRRTQKERIKKGRGWGHRGNC